MLSLLLLPKRHKSGDEEDATSRDFDVADDFSIHFRRPEIVKYCGLIDFEENRENIRFQEKSCRRATTEMSAERGYNVARDFN